jgi:hypothetical protein
MGNGFHIFCGDFIRKEGRAGAPKPSESAFFRLKFQKEG